MESQRVSFLDNESIWGTRFLSASCHKNVRFFNVATFYFNIRIGKRPFLKKLGHLYDFLEMVNVIRRGKKALDIRFLHRIFISKRSTDNDRYCVEGLKG